LFKEIFDDIHSRNPETYLIGIWGKDGLELDKAVYLPPEADMDLIGAELADVVGKLDNLDLDRAGFLIEYVSGKLKIMVLSLNSGYFLLLVSSKNVISGKLKFYLDLKKDGILALL
jgi:predicted regulator of Ras-like GTPase activity (Roadblock/LC7/MglB family)